uniref:Mechanosensitive ion channel protein 6-like n=1 Tax=Tanacetum cinerariifolium TaxID=118510 RepID=A0A6L2J2T9_TANCI|nr:mechanosensitive ion channel protein 6-like [Tanacetum cinerariifolium]
MIGKSGKFSETTTPKNPDEGTTIDHLHRLNQKNISAWNMKRLMNIVRTGTKVSAKKIFINVSKQGSKSLHIGIFKMVAHAQKEVKPQID